MTGISITSDTGTEFEPGAAEYNAVARLSDSTFIVAYRDLDDGSKGKVIVGTRSGYTISINEADVVTFETGETKGIDITALSSSLFVISYVDVGDSNNPKVIAGTVLGTTITLGTAVTIITREHNLASVCALDSEYFVVCTLPVDNVTYQILSTVGSISGTTITLGSTTDSGIANSSGDYQLDCADLNSTDYVFVYRGTDYPKARVGIVNKTDKTITFGDIATLLYIPFGNMAVASFDELHFIVVGWFASVYATSGAVIAGVISDTTHEITVGSALGNINPEAGDTWHVSICTMDSTHFIVSFNDVGDSQKGKLRAGSLSGSTTLALDAQGEVEYDSNTITYTGICKMTSDYFLIGFKET
jgi:hypothetical protein